MVSILRHIDKHKNQRVAVRQRCWFQCIHMGQHSSSIYIWIIIAIGLCDIPELIYFY